MPLNPHSFSSVLSLSFAILSLFVSPQAHASDQHVLDLQILKGQNIKYHYDLNVELDDASDRIARIGLVHHLASNGHWVFNDRIFGVGTFANMGGGEIHPGVTMTGSLDTLGGGAVKLEDSKGNEIFVGALLRDASGFKLCKVEQNGCKKLKAIQVTYSLGFTGYNYDFKPVY